MRRPALSALFLASAFASPAPAVDRLAKSAARTIDGKPIPPQIFADFGIAASGSTLERIRQFPVIAI
jgi:hypothetical protein